MSLTHAAFILFACLIVLMTGQASAAEKKPAADTKVMAQEPAPGKHHALAAKKKPAAPAIMSDAQIKKAIDDYNLAVKGLSPSQKGKLSDIEAKYEAYSAFPLEILSVSMKVITCLRTSPEYGPKGAEYISDMINWTKTLHQEKNAYRDFQKAVADNGVVKADILTKYYNALLIKKAKEIKTDSEAAVQSKQGKQVCAEAIKTVTSGASDTAGKDDAAKVSSKATKDSDNSAADKAKKGGK